jgi:hypothetical protein
MPRLAPLDWSVSEPRPYIEYGESVPLWAKVFADINNRESDKRYFLIILLRIFAIWCKIIQKK